MAKRHWYTGLRGACKVPRTLLGWWYEIKPRAFLDRYALDPDRYCSDCAKTARLALAKESAQKPAEVSERPNCGDKRTDSERYAELRKLVECWQKNLTEDVRAAIRNGATIEQIIERFAVPQSAERIAERGGFSYWEIAELLGREPNTWEPIT